MSSHFCRRVHVFAGQSGKNGGPRLPQFSLSWEVNSPKWSYPKQRSSLPASVGKKKKSLSPACFVVSLKRFAAVSIKQHRSKETPPTEIPTEEGEKEKWEEVVGSERLNDINTKTDAKCLALCWLSTPTTIITIQNLKHYLGKLSLAAGPLILWFLSPFLGLSIFLTLQFLFTLEWFSYFTSCSK